MRDFTKSIFESPATTMRNSLGVIVREGAENLVKLAVMEEFESFFNKYRDLESEDGKQLIVRNGYHSERTVMTGAGDIKVKIPRIADRRGKEGERLSFHSRIMPPYLRRTRELDEFIPLLYLKGISSGNFSEVLSGLLGYEVSLSANTVGRLKKKWETEQEEWKKRSLSGKRYVYWWVDGVYFNIRMESAKSCFLVIMGVTCDGKKELVAVEDGLRESEQSWSGLLLRLKRQGLGEGPLLAIGDGALGFWKALTKEFRETKHQRCWVHKTRNILDKLPKSLQPQAKGMLHEVYLSATRGDAYKAFDDFINVFEAKYPKAVQCLFKDKKELLAFYDFPAQHWGHIRSTNAIESTFATIRLRTHKTRGCLSRKTALAMVFKLAQSAEKRWQRIRGHKTLLTVLEGKRFIDGVRENHEQAA